MTNPDDLVFLQTARTIEAGKYAYEGLTKREYFAVMAMQGMLANSSYDVGYKHMNEAILCADALIEALNK